MAVDLRGVKPGDKWVDGYGSVLTLFQIRDRDTSPYRFMAENGCERSFTKEGRFYIPLSEGWTTKFDLVAPYVAPESVGKTDELPAAEPSNKTVQLPEGHGWIPWSGGECPVPGDALVEVKFRVGTYSAEFRADHWVWTPTGHPLDITAYRIVKPAEPAAAVVKPGMWVEYEGKKFWFTGLRPDNGLVLLQFGFPNLYLAPEKILDIKPWVEPKPAPVVEYIPFTEDGAFTGFRRLEELKKEYDDSLEAIIRLEYTPGTRDVKAEVVEVRG